MSEANVKATELIALANQLQAAIDQEEDIVVKVLQALPGKQAVIDLPAERQWQYEYPKKKLKFNEPPYGVATARHMLLTSFNASGRGVVRAVAGPNRNFLAQEVGKFEVVLQGVGGLDSLLTLIGEEIERKIQMTDKVRGGTAAAQAEALLARISSQK